MNTKKETGHFVDSAGDLNFDNMTPEEMVQFGCNITLLRRPASRRPFDSRKEAERLIKEDKKRQKNKK
jgi:hypothetical protein